MLHLLAAVLVAQGAATTPVRPPDGTYVYAIGEGAGSAILTSNVVVKSSGSTFDVTETAKLPSGDSVTVKTTWDSATLLPVQYTLDQGKVHLEAPVTATSAKFSGAASPSYSPIAGTKYILVSEGLNAFRMMTPYVLKAHPGDSFTVAQINGNQTVKGVVTSATPPAGGPAGDAVTTYTVDNEQIAAWYDPKTNVVDKLAAQPGDGWMRLIKYTP